MNFCWNFIENKPLICARTMCVFAVDEKWKLHELGED